MMHIDWLPFCGAATFFAATVVDCSSMLYLKFVVYKGE